MIADCRVWQNHIIRIILCICNHIPVQDRKMDNYILSRYYRLMRNLNTQLIDQN